MFSIDNEFDVDEDFLANAFETGPHQSSKPHGSGGKFTDRCTSKPLRDINASLFSKNNEKTPVKSKNAEFVDLWKSNEEYTFFAKTPRKSANNLLDRVGAVSPVGVRSESVTRTSKNVRQRKFPGPAGLLPERTASTSFIASEDIISSIENENDKYSSFEDKEVLSQATSKFFEDPGSAWRTMVEDLGSNGSRLISAMNLTTIRIKQAKFGFKVPFLAVCVHNIDCSLPDPSLLLKDKMDEMHGTLHRDVWEDWKCEIAVGSVLVLHNTGVISAGTSSRRYFLNITAKNIVTIYSPKNDSGIKINQIQSVTGLNQNEMLEEWERVMNQTRLQQFVSDSPQGPQPLYSTFSSPRAGMDPSRITSPMGTVISPALSLNRTTGHTFQPKMSLNLQRTPQNSPFRIQSPSSGFSPRTLLLPRGTAQRSPYDRHNGFMRHSSPLQQPGGSPLCQTRQPAQKSLSEQPRPTFQPRGVPRQNNNYNNRQHFPLKQQEKVPVGVPLYNFPTPSSKTNDGQQYNLTYSRTNVTETGYASSHESLPSKKPKISDETENLSKPSTSSVFSVSSDATNSIIDSVLDGIDTNLLFDDF